MKVLIVIFYLFKASLLNKSIDKKLKLKIITANCPQNFERIGSSLYSFIYYSEVDYSWSRQY